MSEPQNSYGFFNHFIISPAQKETAERYDLRIKSLGKGVFELRSKHGTEALQKIGAPFFDKGAQDAVIMPRKTLRALLDFLRQPIAHSSPDEASRKAGHAVTRFLTTGHVEIEKFLDEGLASAASLECHEKGERKMKESDIWRYEPEFWNPDISSEKVSSIPGTSYDPQQGFVFELSDEFMNGGFLQKPSRRKLAQEIRGVLDTIGAEEKAGGSIALNSAQLKDFYKRLQSIPDLDNLIRKARIEEKAEQQIQKVRENAQELKTDARFQIALHARDPRLSDAVRFDNLMLASSRLTPVISSREMFETWRHSHRTEYWMNLSDPVAELSEEMQVFQMVLDDLRNSPDMDAEHLQAVIHSFRPLIGFAADLMASLQEGADHKNVVKVLPEDMRSKFKSEISALSAAFQQASINGVETGDLDGDYEELLTGVGNVLGQNGNLAKQQLTGYVDMMVGFWKGVGESALDSPWVAGALVGFVGYAWYTKYGVDPYLAQQAAETIFSGVDGGAWGADTGNDFGSGGNFTVPQTFLDSFADNSEQILGEARQDAEIDDCLIDANCHYNYLVPQFLLDTMDDSVGQYLKFRHYVGSDIIASNAQTAVELLPSTIEIAYEAADIPVNENTVFRDVVANVTEQGGLFVIDANMFQDASHASMLAYGVTRAGKHGFSAFKGMGGLAAEFFNPAYRIGQAALSPFKRLAANTGYVSGVLNEQRYRGLHRSARPQFESRLMKTALQSVQGAKDKMFVLDSAPEQTIVVAEDKKTETITLNIGWYGLGREKITLTQEGVADFQRKLNDFALVLKYSGDDIGIESEHYADFVLDKIESVECALEAYQNSDSADKVQELQNALNGDLQHVIGAELKFNGRDQLYRTLFPEPEERPRGFLARLFTEKAGVKDERRLHVLARHASKKEGRMIRAEFREEMKEARADGVNRFSKPDRPVSLKSLACVILPTAKYIYGEIEKLGANRRNSFEKPEKVLTLQSLKYVWGEVSRRVTTAKFTLAIPLNHAWGGIVFAAREGIQEPFNQIPNKGKLALAFGAACLGGMAADVAGINTALTNSFSAAGAALSGITATGVIAGLMNVPQDLALHTAAISVSALAVGVPWYYSVQKGVKPAAHGIREMLNREP